MVIPVRSGNLPLRTLSLITPAAGRCFSRFFPVACSMAGKARGTAYSYDTRLISAYAFGARWATLVRCAARETSLATIGATFRLKTDGMM